MRINWSVVIGLVGGVGMVVASIVLSTKMPMIFFHEVAAIIVVGGLICAALIMKSVSDNWKMIQKIWYMIRAPGFNHHEFIAEVISVAQKNTQGGGLLFEKDVSNIANGMFREAVELVGMGYKPEEIRKFLTLRMESTESALLSFSASLLSLAKLCPAFGLLGTLVGLIILLYNMGTGDINEVGPAMAISLTATLYGVFISNVFLTPLADFINYFAENTRMQDLMTIEAAVMLKEKRHYIQILELLKSYIPRHEQEELTELLTQKTQLRASAGRRREPAQETEKTA